MIYMEVTVSSTGIWPSTYSTTAALIDEHFIVLLKSETVGLNDFLSTISPRPILYGHTRMTHRPTVFDIRRAHIIRSKFYSTISTGSHSLMLFFAVIPL